MTDTDVTIPEPWLVPLSRGGFRSVVTRRLTRAALVVSDGITYIHASLPLSRNTRRIGGSDRVMVRGGGSKYIGTVERASCDKAERHLVIRVAM